MGAGRPKGSKKRVAPEQSIEDAAAKAGQTPLEYMLAVMNDPNVDDARRDRLAVAAAPYLHPKKGESGKKEDADTAARAAGAGKFAPKQQPKLVVINS